MEKGHTAEFQHALRVCAIIVTYFPDLALLEKMLKATIPQVQGMVIVDNTPNSEKQKPLAEVINNEGITFFEKGTNVGLGEGQNIGISWAKSHGFTHILLLDQDSVPAPDMIGRLAVAMETFQKIGIKVSAVGPKIINSHTRKDMRFVRFGWFGLKKIICNGFEKASSIRVDHLIASGSLISIKTLDEIGWMDEGFFIDYIDTDWHLKASSKGFQGYGVCDAVLFHGFGEGSFRVWLGHWQYRPKRSAWRFYFIFRNSMVLGKRDYAPLKWKVSEWIRLGRRFLFYSVFVAPRLQYVRMMVKGIWHGLRGKTGGLKA